MQALLFPYLRRGALLLTPFLLAACAGAGGGHGAAEVTEGKFEPHRSAASNYGVDPAVSCPRTGAIGVVSTDLETRAKQNQKPVPQADGRLCAMADTLLGWKGDAPDDHVITFLSNYFGLTAPVPAVLITTIDTNDPNLIGARLVDPVWKFSQTAVQPRFGLAVQRTSAGRAELSKIVLLMQDAPVDIQPFPRKLASNSQANLSGKLAAGFQNPKLYLTDPTGHLEAPTLGSGRDFQSDVRCGDKPGTIRIELRGERSGAENILATFPVSCGTDQPTAIALAPAAAAAAAAGSGPPERRLFDLINNERSQAGLAPLQWDDAVAAIAISISNARRDQLKVGGEVKVDIVGQLKSAGIQSPVVLTNPAAARSPEEAQERFASSPTHRANYMSTEVTHVGIGTAQATDQAGRPVTLYTEVFVHELPPVNVEELRTKLQNAIVQHRKDARAGSIKTDPTLQEVAQQFADELAASQGSLPKSRQDELLKPLKGKYGAVNVVSGAKADPLEFAEESIVVTGGNLMGVGVALGLHPALGKNAPYVAEIISSPPAAAKKAPTPKPKK